MKHLKPLALIFTFILAACSSIDEADRQVYVAPAEVSRAVLIEDFTGQRCVNCPNAAEEIARLQAEYGEDNVVAVAIHSGPLAIFPNATVTGLRSDLGDAYYDYWKVEAEPSGLINRRDGVLLLNQWGARVYEELQTKAPVELSLQVQWSEQQAVVAVTCQALQDVEGRLQIWLTEDGIVAPQMMPDGTLDRNYVHNHVLRSAVNGTWGTEVAWKQGEMATLQFEAPIAEEWGRNRLAVVAFVYDQHGVLQVARQK